MSASRERKKRAGQVNEPAVPQQKKSKKLSEGWVFAICIVLVVAIVFGGLFAYRAVQRNKTVLTAGGHEVSVKEFNYFYYSLVSNIGNYASYLGIESGAGLADQYVKTSAATYLGLFGLDSGYLSEVDSTDEYYSVTWAQFLAHAAMENAASVYGVCAEAEKNGFELDEDELAEIDEEIDAIADYADQAGYSLNKYIGLLFGTGCNESGYREYLKATHIASHYPQSLDYTDEELSTRYDENPETFDKATFYSYTVRASEFMESTTDEETGETLDPTDENRDEAKKAAEEMQAKFDVESDKVTVSADYTKTSVTSSFTEEAAEWMFGDAKAGDVKLFASEDGNTYYVLKLLDKDDYNTFDLLYMYVPDDSTSSDDTEDTENTEDTESDEPTAEEKVASIKESLEADGSRENFTALTSEYTSSSTDVLEAAGRNSLAAYSKDALTWGAFETRKEGDWNVFKGTSGTYFVYFVGLNEHTLRYYNVTNQLRNDWYTETTQAAIDACNYDEDAAMNAAVNRILSSNNS